MNITKRDVLISLLSRGSIFVMVDPKIKNILIPERLMKEEQFQLLIGYNLPNPILDLKIDELGITGTLFFNREPFYCSIPWEAVFGFSWGQDEGMLFTRTKRTPKPIAPTPTKPALRLVKN